MKMRKILLIVMAVLMCLTCFIACDEEQKPSTSSGSGSSGSDSGDISVTIPNEYDNLNEMLKQNYSKISITVTDKYDEEISLTSNYVLSFAKETVTVDYTVERFNEISLDKPNTDVKSTTSGQAVIENGKIKSNSANVLITPDILELIFEFKEEYFENIELTGIYLKADVKDAKSFMGTTITCKDTKVYAEFLDAFYQIKVNYTNENGVQVEYNYQFTV